MMPPEDMLASDLPSAALRLTPFHPSHYDMESGEWSYPPSRSSRAGSSSMCLFPPCHFDSSDAELVALPPAAVRTSHEKKASLPDLSGGDVVFPGECFRRQSILSRCSIHALLLDVENTSAPTNGTHGLPIRRTIMANLVDYVTQQVAQRMDPSSPLPPGPNLEQDAPPLYSSPPARVPSAIERQARR